MLRDTSFTDIPHAGYLENYIANLYHEYKDVFHYDEIEGYVRSQIVVSIEGGQVLSTWDVEQGLEKWKQRILSGKEDKKIWYAREEACESEIIRRIRNEKKEQRDRMSFRIQNTPATLEIVDFLYDFLKLSEEEIEHFLTTEYLAYYNEVYKLDEYEYDNDYLKKIIIYIQDHAYLCFEITEDFLKKLLKTLSKCYNDDFLKLLTNNKFYCLPPKRKEEILDRLLENPSDNHLIFDMITQTELFRLPTTDSIENIITATNLIQHQIELSRENLEGNEKEYIEVIISKKILNNTKIIHLFPNMNLIKKIIQKIMDFINEYHHIPYYISYILSVLENENVHNKRDKEWIIDHLIGEDHIQYDLIKIIENLDILKIFSQIEHTKLLELFLKCNERSKLVDYTTITRMVYPNEKKPLDILETLRFYYNGIDSDERLYDLSSYGEEKKQLHYK